jgi:protein-S-isoprenylcysteine O-methyltransferase Ste14
MNVLLFKLVQLAIIVVLIVFISDFRRKRDMVPLVRERWTSILKMAYLVPLAVYAHALIRMQSIASLDFIALAMTLLGTFLVIRAKRDLAAHHTWAGYCLKSERFTAHGIYAYIRHPLYTGIYIVVLGSLFTILPRLNLSQSIALPAAALFSVSYVMGFLALLANRETSTLLDKYGVPFRRYMESVHPFLPLRRYVQPRDD